MTYAAMLLTQLTHLSVSGFKSLERIENLPLEPINLMIGPNAAGKSNLVAVFRMLSYMLSGDGLQDYVGRSGRGNAVLFDGAAVTTAMNFAFRLRTKTGVVEYAFRLVYAAGDTLVFNEERWRFQRDGASTQARWTGSPPGHTDSRLRQRGEQGSNPARTILALLRQIKVFQFHNTSAASRMRQSWPVSDGLYLKEDGANLAPVLLALQDHYPKHYRKLVDTLRLVVPQFADFTLEPEYDKVYLRWRERGSDLDFGAHQASDGTLRLMALLTLLIQPAERRPALLVLDEPELGLHPAAIRVVAEQMAAAAEETQLLVATQSPQLLDQFTPSDVIVADRRDRATDLRRLEPDELAEWLADYTLSELWDKNLFGGRPA